MDIVLFKQNHSKENKAFALTEAIGKGFTDKTTTNLNYFDIYFHL